MFPACFYVHRGGASQQLYHNQYNRVMVAYADFNDGGNYDLSQSRWVAPTNGVVHLSAQLMLLSGLAIGAQLVMKFIENSSLGNPPPQIPNGSDCFAPVTMVVARNPAVIAGDGWWKVSEGDAIELAIFPNCPGNAGVLDGHRAHTYWSGAFFPRINLEVDERIRLIEAKLFEIETGRRGGKVETDWIKPTRPRRRGDQDAG